MKKTLILCAALTMLLGVFSGCAQAYDPYKEKKNPVVESECGNFSVQLYNEDKNGIEKGNAVVLELTEAGRLKEVLAIPSHVEGMPVTQIGLSVKNGFRTTNWEIGNYDGSCLKKIYLPYTIINIPKIDYSIMASGVALRCEEIVLLSKEAPMRIAVEATLLVVLFPRADIPLNSAVNTAPNLIYRYNYQSAVNEGYFWIDYITGDNLTIDPIHPTRDGFIFTGWFVDVECFTQWDGAKPSSKDDMLELFAGWQ